MAEGGGRRLGECGRPGQLKLHFSPITVRGGQYVNLAHGPTPCAEAPDRVRSWRPGCLFDRTPDGRIRQRNFGGQSIRVWRTSRPTGLEMIRTLQDHSIHHGIDVHIIAPFSDSSQTVAGYPLQ